MDVVLLCLIGALSLPPSLTVLLAYAALLNHACCAMSEPQRKPGTQPVNPNKSKNLFQEPFFPVHIINYYGFFNHLTFFTSKYLREPTVSPQLWYLICDVFKTIKAKMAIKYCFYGPK